jgi:hypothetical protein
MECNSGKKDIIQKNKVFVSPPSIKTVLCCIVSVCFMPIMCQELDSGAFKDQEKGEFRILH